MTKKNNHSTRDKETTSTKATTCNCYCIQGWGAALPNPELPDGPAVVTGWFRTQTETETGKIVWTATVVEKIYDCTTKVVSNTIRHANVNLSKNNYTKTRTRTRVWVARTRTILGVTITYYVWVWGAWGGWTLTNGPAHTERVSLGFPSPAMLPWCGDENVTCP